ncbi:hypothetical protein B5G09_03975 [Alistipes sp. An54]|nr:hypothetical protein B5G09_03975 [Alistipes sp. An54]
MLGCIITVLLCINIAIWIALDILCWTSGMWPAGVAGILAILGFLIAYTVSEEISISPRDIWTHCEFDIFKTKLKNAWSTGCLIWIIGFIILASLFLT